MITHTTRLGALLSCLHFGVIAPPINPTPTTSSDTVPTSHLLIKAFEADYNMNRDDFRFNVPIADAFPPRGSSLARVPAELPPAAAGKNALMPDDFCFNMPIVHAFLSLGSSLAQGVAEVLPAAAGADESMPDGSTELYEV